MDTDDRFEQLKARFRPALDFLEAQNIPIQAVNVQDGRLLVRAVASSPEQRDRIMERFHRIDPSLEAVFVDLRMDRANVPETGQSVVQNSGDFSQQGEAAPGTKGR